MSGGPIDQSNSQPAPTSTRIDSAHSVRDKGRPLESTDEPSRETVEAIAGNDSEQLGEQMRSQANELATHLRAQQRSLERREATYNSCLAQLENELRMSRLSMREREQKLADRETESKQRFSQLEGELASLAQAKLPLEKGSAGARVVQRVRAETGENEWNSRQQILEHSEALLERQLTELDASRQHLTEERSALEVRSRTDHERLKDEQRSLEAELDKQRQTLVQHRNALEKRHVAVEQLYSEVMQMHRESLEMRLCTEQLWADLSGRASQPELTQKLGQLRKGLADHFKLASQSLTQQRSELQDLLSRLAEQQKKTKHQRSEVQRWVERRQKEMEEQAARLVARQQELDSQEAEIHRLREQWDAQRREYQEEIRHLMSKLRNATSSQVA